MTINFKYVQAQNFSLAGSGVIAGATSLTLKSLVGIDGVLLTMIDFGLIGFATIEPGNGTQEEQISFTGVIQNANGTATLTGVKTVLFINPYTATSGLAKTHPGSATLIITNTSGFYSQFTAKANDETVTGDWTFSGQVTFAIAPISPITNPKATDAIYGIVKLSVAAASATDPIVVGTNDPRVPIAYAIDSVGTDAYAINPSPAITAYVAGQVFSFKAGTANTGACSLNVNGLGAKTIKRNVSIDLLTGDILQNQIITVIYDGTNMQLISATQFTGVLPIVNGGTGRAVSKKSGVTTSDGSSATTVIAHGLGVVPSFVKIISQKYKQNNLLTSSVGTYCGTIATLYQYEDSSAVLQLATNTTYIVYLQYDIGSAGIHSLGTYSADDTNITITWSHAAGGVASTILWEAE